jgi:hypothetical protein
MANWARCGDDELKNSMILIRFTRDLTSAEEADLEKRWNSLLVGMPVESASFNEAQLQSGPRPAEYKDEK